MFPESVFLIRGSHELECINKIYGFKDECKKKCDNLVLYDLINQAFEYLPLGAVINKKALCLVGGISPTTQTLQDIQSISRPIPNIDTNDTVIDLLYSAPKESNGWEENPRRAGKLYGPDVLNNFLQANSLDILIKSEYATVEGYFYSANKKVLTIFSTPNYEGQFGNKGTYLSIGPDCSEPVINQF